MPMVSSGGFGWLPGARWFISYKNRPTGHLGLGQHHSDRPLMPPEVKGTAAVGLVKFQLRILG